jgi:hypothetical protein
LLQRRQDESFYLVFHRWIGWQCEMTA